MRPNGGGDQRHLGRLERDELDGEVRSSHLLLRRRGLAAMRPRDFADGHERERTTMMSKFNSIALIGTLAAVPNCAAEDPEETTETDGSSSTGPSSMSAAAATATTSNASASDSADPGTAGPTTASSTSPSSTGESTTTSPATTETPETDSAEETGESGSTTTGERADCSDQLILDLGLVEGVVSDSAMTNTADGSGWVSTIDATAGGLPNAPMNPWEYLRFTDTGLERIAVDDLDALSSTQWHIAVKRFGIRINSGNSGPSTVAAAAVFDGDYDAISELPNGALPLTDDFYSEACVLVDDGSGLGAPNYTLTPWWSYPGCVATTGVPFVIELDDGAWVKFVVDAYYESGQDDCNASGAMGSGSANFTWRWAFLP